MKSMTIGKRLLLCFGAAFVVTLIVGVVALSGVGTLENTIDRLVRVNARKLFLAGEINTVMSDFMVEERGVLIRGYLKDRAAMDQNNQDFKVSTNRMKKRLDEFASLTETAEGRRIVAEIGTAVDQLGQYQDEIYRLASNGQVDAAAEFARAKFVPVAQQANAAAERLVVLQQQLAAATAQAAGSSVSQVRWVTILMICLSLVVGAVVIFIVRNINKSLRQTVAELDEGAGQTASAASQVSGSSQTLAQGASEQAASLEETSASSEEISSMARRNSENSHSAAALVTQSQQKFTETNQSLDQMVAAMGEINASSDKISKIIKTIDEIAFQTNILALNAAVEAARAGEAGLGFAVVADEVRNLAQRCAQAAKDTAELIEDSISKSNGGKAKVDQVAVAFRDIAELSGKVKILVDEVNLGSEEQARGIDQIGKAIVQMEQVTQKTAAGAEESASAAEELTAQSATLREIVRRLSAMVDGDDGHRGHTSAGVHHKAPAVRSAIAIANRRDEPFSSRTSFTRGVAGEPNKQTSQPTPTNMGAGKNGIPFDDDFEEF